MGGSSLRIEVFSMTYTILIEGIKGNRQLRIPSRRRHDRIKPGIKLVLRLMLTMRLPSDGLFASKSRYSILFG